MRLYIKSCLIVLFLAARALPAAAQELPTFNIGGPGQTVPALPPPPSLPPPQAVPGPVAPLPPHGPQPQQAVPGLAFSGSTDIAAIIEGAIRSSSFTVEAALYGLTLPGVAQALVDARDRGVKVRVIMNESHVFTTRRDDGVQLLIDKGVDMRTLRGTGRNGIMHNKLGIYDGRLVSAGSFNWAVTANEANSENAVFLRDADTVAGYGKYFEWMWGLARPVADGPAGNVKDYGPPPAAPARSVAFGGARFPAYSFSPGGETKADVISALDRAASSADIAVFSFYDEDIAGAAVNALKRGVKVRVLVDRVQASQSDVGSVLVKAGVQFRWSKGFAGKGVMHNKFAVLDGKLLMTGSFNWSTNAQQNNFENMFYTASPAYTEAYSAQFEELFSAADEPTLDDLQRARAEYRSLSSPR
ncbi:MAG: phospholipase D-like domain-containing protein [Elusimicrobia bacterium]|nr:phospholipase D-like domain-containing protein [Elusimicrobiota bacterium]